MFCMRKSINCFMGVNIYRKLENADFSPGKCPSAEIHGQLMRWNFTEEIHR